MEYCIQLLLKNKVLLCRLFSAHNGSAGISYKWNALYIYNMLRLWYPSFLLWIILLCV